MTETSHHDEPGPGSRHDAARVEAITAGDRDAFTRAFTRHRSDVYRFARHMTGSADAADDVTQETFLALMQMPGRFDATRGSLRQYLLGIARNVVASRLREHRWWGPSRTPTAPAARRMGTVRSRLFRARQRLAVALATAPMPAAEGVTSRCLA